jgi:hypothetical protein
VRLNKLIPPLLDAVDAGTLKFVPAADFLSHLSEKEQTYLLLVMEHMTNYIFLLCKIPKFSKTLQNTAVKLSETPNTIRFTAPLL